MPKFSDAERANIEEDIYKKGKELFIDYGLKKTSIDDIVNACNIGKGTFYTFFSSKEELYFRLLEREHKYFENIIKFRLSNSNKPLKEEFKDIVKDSFRYMDKSPLIVNCFQKKELEQVLRKLPSETFEEHVKNDYNNLFFFLENWQNEGKIIKEDPLVLSKIFYVLVLSMSFKQELGGDAIFSKVMDMLIDFVIDGMFNTKC